ncbi:MAG: hypothetical protein R2784_12200 [Saprospiraceae bacterium]
MEQRPVKFTTASDVGWVVGYSYIVYGPLINGSTNRFIRSGNQSELLMQVLSEDD